MNDALKLLSIYTPTLFDCATRNITTAERVRSKYRERWRSLASAIERDGRFSAMASIFDLLWDASENKVGSKEYLTFIDTITRKALSQAQGHAKRQIEKLIITMITSFGKERSEYKNHFAEIAVISRLQEDSTFTLLCVEKKLPNGNCMDFEVSKDGRTSLIEVYNIDFIIEKLHSPEDFRTFLDNRIVKKLTDKLEGLVEIDVPCILIPVLWGDIVGLQAYSSVLSMFKPGKVVGPFMMIAQSINTRTGQIGYRFGSVESFLEKQRIGKTAVRGDPRLTGGL